MIKLYKRLILRCKTINEINRVHISLEDRLSPLEIAAIIKQLPGDFRQSGWARVRKLLLGPLRALKFPRTAYRWLKLRFVDKEARRKAEYSLKPRKKPGADFPLESYLWSDQLSDWFQRSKKSYIEPFVRKRILPNIVFYTSGVAAEQKKLLICMTGKSFRMMVPVPTFLQHIHANEYDVLVLKDPRKNAYRSGLKGLGNNLEELITSIDSIVDRKKYQKVVSLGVSAGGLPAILLCLKLKLDKGISVGGNSATDPRWQHFGGDIHQTLANLVNQPGYVPNLLFIYGADHQRDKESAFSISGEIPSRLLEVRSRSPELEVGHNVLYKILAQSRLDEFLLNTLDPQIDGYRDLHKKAKIGQPGIYTL